MKKRSLVLSASVATALVVATAAPALATPWDGNNFDFGYGRNWEFSNSMYFDEVSLGESAAAFGASTSGGYMDIWDGSLLLTVDSQLLGLPESSYECPTAEDIDITTSDEGDLLIECTTRWADVTNPDVDIRANMRVMGPDGDLVRTVLTITNNSGEDITDISVLTYTNFGSGGYLAGYQNFDETVIAAGAVEASENRDLLNGLGAQWIVHTNESDAPGTVAWGNAEGAVATTLVDPTSGDSYYTATDRFTVAAGETVHLAYFTGWNPADLIADGFLEYVDPTADVYTALVADAAEFDSFSGRLVRGLPEGANVLNWGVVEAEEVPEEEALAETGADVSTLWIAFGLLAAGAATVAVRRRARA